jgi:hypothetical protein
MLPNSLAASLQRRLATRADVLLGLAPSVPAPRRTPRAATLGSSLAAKLRARADALLPASARVQ